MITLLNANLIWKMWPIFHWKHNVDKSQVSLQPGCNHVVCVISSTKCPSQLPGGWLEILLAWSVPSLCNWNRSGSNHQTYQTYEIFLKQLMASPTPSIFQQIPGQCKAALVIGVQFWDLSPLSCPIYLLMRTNTLRLISSSTPEDTLLLYLFSTTQVIHPPSLCPLFFFFLSNCQ